MILIPFESIEFKSSLKKDEILNIINYNIKKNTEMGLIASKDENLEFEGYLENHTFKIRRILKYGYNAFIPIILGTVIKENHISIIKLRFRFPKFVALFIVFITLFMGSLIIIPLFESESTKEKLEKLDEITQEAYEKGLISEEKYKNLTNKEEKVNWNKYILLIAPYILSLIVFNYESKIAKDKLQMMFRTNDNIS